MADELKALTVVNLPFLDDGKGRPYLPGSMIPREAFEEYVALAAKGHRDLTDEDPNATPPPNADDVIRELIEWGSLSEDPDAPLHPDHLPVDPAKPTLARLIEQARSLIDEHNARGLEVPSELQALAATDYQHVTSADVGSGGDNNA